MAPISRRRDGFDGPSFGQREPSMPASTDGLDRLARVAV
jgi:hypothetical protein